jgi:hypothetical protein
MSEQYTIDCTMELYRRAVELVEEIEADVLFQDDGKFNYLKLFKYEDSIRLCEYQDCIDYIASYQQAN